MILTGVKLSTQKATTTAADVAYLIKKPPEIQKKKQRQVKRRGFMPFFHRVFMTSKANKGIRDKKWKRKYDSCFSKASAAPDHESCLFRRRAFTDL